MGSLWDEEERRELTPAQHLRKTLLTLCLPMHRHTHPLQDAHLTPAQEAVSSSDTAHHFWSI